MLQANISELGPIASLDKGEDVLSWLEERTTAQLEKVKLALRFYTDTWTEDDIQDDTYDLALHNICLWLDELSETQIGKLNAYIQFEEGRRASETTSELKGETAVAVVDEKFGGSDKPLTDPASQHEGLRKTLEWLATKKSAQINKIQFALDIKASPNLLYDTRDGELQKLLPWIEGMTAPQIKKFKYCLECEKQRRDAIATLTTDEMPYRLPDMDEKEKDLLRDNMKSQAIRGYKDRVKADSMTACIAMAKKTMAAMGLLWCKLTSK